MNTPLTILQIPKPVREVMDLAVKEGLVYVGFFYCLALHDGLNFQSMLEHLREYTAKLGTEKGTSFSLLVRKVIHDLYHE